MESSARKILRGKYECLAVTLMIWILRFICVLFYWRHKTELLILGLEVLTWCFKLF